MITCLGLSPALDVTYGVDALTPGGIHRPQWRVALPGGKFLNVARALRLLGAPVGAIVPLGGPLGAQLEADLRADGLEVVVVPTRAPTRTCVSIVSAADDTITEVYENAPALDDAAWAGVVAALSSVEEGWLSVSGSVPPERTDELADALAAASARGIRLALDQRGGALEAALAAMDPDIVKVNRVEAEEAVGAGSAAELAVRLRARGAGIAIVTDGAAGSVAADAAGAWRAGPVAAGPYTVGAGDSFQAGLLSALVADRPLVEALRHAASVAAANTLRPGAALFDPEDVTRLAAEIDVRSVGVEDAA